MITLRKFNERFHDNLISWIDSEKTLMQFAGPLFTFPLTSEQLDKSLSAKNRYAFGVFENETIIGHAEIYLSGKTAYLGKIIIGNKELRGKGRGQKVVSKLLDIAFIKFNKTQVSLNVFDWNINAIRCYEKVGFEINSDKNLERRISKENWIALNMVLSKDNWERRKGIKRNTENNRNLHSQNITKK
jgi:RimJ/RimL family protein N-acetyltransferase